MFLNKPAVYDPFPSINPWVEDSSLPPPEPEHKRPIEQLLDSVSKVALLAFRISVFAVYVASTYSASRIKSATLYTSSTVVSTAVHISDFIAQNWKAVVAYCIAWSIIVLALGASFGFSAVSIPTLIGFGGGSIAGIFSAIFIVKVLDRKNSWSEKNTICRVVKKYLLDQIDAEATKALLTAISVSVIFMLAAKYPIVTGAITGAIIFNQVTTMIIEPKKQKPIKEQETPKEDLLKRLESMEEEIKSLRRQIENSKSTSPQDVT